MMNRQNLGKHILIMIEAAALCVVLVMSTMALATKGPKPSVVGPSGTENTIGDYVTETELKIPGEEAALAYKEERLTFSEAVETKLASMTTEEKVAQLFLLTAEKLTGVEQVTVSGNGTKNALNQYPVGGIVYDGDNFTDEEQIKLLTGNAQAYSMDRIGLPLFITVGEEGGVDRSPIAKVNGYEITMSPGKLGSLGEVELVTEAVNTRMEYVKENGFNVVFGAMGNLAQGLNAYDDDRTYGRDWSIACELMEADMTAVNENDMTSILRYFPKLYDAGKYTEGIGSELAVFQAGIDAGAKIVMVSNAKAQYMTGDRRLPCSLSEGTVAYIRGAMGYEGILMTSSLSENRLVAAYSSEEAAVKAIVAGMDMILEPTDFVAAYEAVLEAVNDGTISQMRLENAVGRILELKMR